MTKKINHSAVKKLRVRYVVALSIIACLIIISQFLIQYNIDKQQDDSSIINLAGRQRMLSQKITKTVLTIDKTGNPQNLDLLLLELDSAIDLWEKSQKGLISGDATLGLPGKNGDKVSMMFDSIAFYHRNMLEAAKSYSTVMKVDPTDPALHEHIQTILLNEGGFLTGMDEIVFQYDFEASEKVHQISLIEWVLLILTLFTLAVEVRFIFIPLEKHIQGSLNDLIDSEDNIRKLFDVAPSAMLLVAVEDYSIVRLNEMACDILGLPFNKAIERKFYDFVFGDHLDVLSVASVKGFYGEMKQVEAVLRNEQGESLVMLMSVTQMYFHGSLIFLIGLSDITDRKKHEDALKELATTDDMTKLLNRRTGLLILTKEMEKAKRENYELSIGFIDLDGLKKVNDNYGHTEGDWFIKKVGEVLIQNVRLGDVVFRYGGDEMILVLGNCGGEDAEVIMKRIQLDLSQINKKGEKPFKIGLSYGIADHEIVNPKDIDTFITYADEKMYEQKLLKKATRLD